MHHWRTCSLFVVALFVAGACSTEGLSTHSEEIIGGIASFDDDAVVQLDIGCTGALIAPNVVLTAAHCVPAGRVFFGVDDDNRFATRNIIDIFVARDYEDNGLFAGSDVAILRLSEDAPPEVTPIPYNTTALTEADEGRFVRIVGFGQDEFGGSGVRKQAQVPINAIDDRLIQTDDPNATVCFGDSGGPMLLDMDGTEVVIGVASFVQGNCGGIGRHGRVDIYEDVFIRQVLAAWSGPCSYDGTCDTGASCGEFADPDCDICGLDTVCASGCDVKDLDCPFGALGGELCNSREDCEGLLCIEAPDDSRINFCSNTCGECASNIPICASGAGPNGEDACTFDGPSVSAQGAECLQDADCRSNLCDESERICVEQCGEGLAECSEEYECRELTAGVDACRLPDDGGGCRAAPSGGPAGLVVLMGALLLALRRRRRD